MKTLASFTCSELKFTEDIELAILKLIEVEAILSFHARRQYIHLSRRGGIAVFARMCMQMRKTNVSGDKLGGRDAMLVRVYWIPRVRVRCRKYIDYIYLIAFESVQQRHTYDGGLDAGVVCQRGEAEALHLDVHHTGLLQLREILHLVGLRELAERAVQATLALVEVVRAHGLADYGVVGIVAVGQGLQVAG